MITIEPSVPSQTVFARSVPEVILVEINSTGATNGFVIPGVANLFSSVQYTIVVQQETNGTWNLDSVRFFFFRKRAKCIECVHIEM